MASNKESLTLRVVTVEGRSKLLAAAKHYQEEAENGRQIRINRAVAHGLMAVAAGAPKDIGEDSILSKMIEGAEARKLSDTEQRAALRRIREEVSKIRVEERIKLKQPRPGKSCRRLAQLKPA